MFPKRRTIRKSWIVQIDRRVPTASCTACENCGEELTTTTRSPQSTPTTIHVTGEFGSAYVKANCGWESILIADHSIRSPGSEFYRVAFPKKPPKKLPKKSGTKFLTPHLLCQKNEYIFMTDSIWENNWRIQLDFLHFQGAWTQTGMARSSTIHPSVMSSFLQIKLDIMERNADGVGMKTSPDTLGGKRRVTRLIRQRIGEGGERLWRYEDFKELPFTAVGQAFARMTRQGFLERLSKGIYYRSRETAFGKSRPNPSAIERLAKQRKAIFPAGIAAANLLGFTTQSGKRGDISTNATSLPRKLIGKETVVHTLRPTAWSRLSQQDAALLEFLRDGGRSSELPPPKTIRRLLDILSEAGRFERLLKIARFEPPRVRAILGALGTQLGANPASLRRLRQTLNPLTRFDFGSLSALRHADEWQAKRRKEDETSPTP